ncbi:hypothetical protein JJB09_18490 [Rhizobium sp. KVB221]|uniref:Uncharacterized protein n=1 Tax=Rhizobium setariae TaxID=2801340 RepID=A0A936YQU9_9HYPH|nr:hypothetical protein [Rhizobium setariae]MBL0374013.1 hypothetical protein [Rhizobium setariae]
METIETGGRGVTEDRKLDLLDRLHDLRDLLSLIELASMSISMRHERDAMQRGTIVAKCTLKEIIAMADPDLEGHHGDH